MADVVVVGAGVCGLGLALLLARDGHKLTVLERDQSEPPDAPQDAWDTWQRKGVAQFRQPHNFMPGLRALLEEDLPDVQDALIAAGATKMDLVNPNPFPDDIARKIDDRLWTYTARRPLVEAVFARAAGMEDRFHIRRGVSVKRLVTGTPVSGSAPHVIGVETESGDTILADLVVDATGRVVRSAGWLKHLRARPPFVEEADSGFTYYTRYFRGAIPERVVPMLAVSIGTITLLTLPGDNETWSVTVYCSSHDKALKSLRRTDHWTRVVRACPLHAHWLDGEPVTNVLAMSGVIDRYSRLVVDDEPVVTGLVRVGDAWACTNPSAGRGITVGMLHARCLRDVLRKGIEDPAETAVAFHDATEREVSPWYHAQVARDRDRFSEIEALRNGTELPVPVGLGAEIKKLFAGMPRDPELFRAGLEYLGTLTPVQEVLRRSDVKRRISSAMLAMETSSPAPLPGPNRSELLALVA